MRRILILVAAIAATPLAHAATIGATWAHGGQGQAYPTVHAPLSDIYRYSVPHRGYSLSVADTAGAFRLGAEVGQASARSTGTPLVPLPGVRREIQSASLHYLVAHGTWYGRVSQHVMLSIRGTVAQTETITSGDRYTGYFRPGGGAALDVFGWHGGYVRFGVSQQAWRTVQPVTGEIEAPTDRFIVLGNDTGVAVRYDRYVSHMRSVTGYNRFAVSYRDGGTRIAVGRSTAFSAQSPELGAVRDAVDPMRPWLAYAGGDYVKVSQSLGQSWTVAGLFMRGHSHSTPIFDFTGGESMAVRLSYTF